ncbi:MAG: hypothetical protein FJZ00_06775, partial [Candidatus Sericytochromatia bacterium]|nr:hypothetical protein [Candidatus Tanganyikabacteria bacterium]
GVREYEQHLLCHLGEALSLGGQLEEAEMRYRRVLEVGEAIGAMGAMARAQEGLAEIAFKGGDAETATKLLRDAYEHAATVESRFLAGEIALLRGRVHQSQGHSQVAAEWYERTIKWGQDASCPHLVVMGQYGLACVVGTGDSQVRLKTAQSLLKAQVEGLDSALVEGYCSIADRGAIHLGTLPEAATIRR